MRSATPSALWHPCAAANCTTSNWLSAVPQSNQTPTVLSISVNVAGMTAVGEMHVRHGRYIGVAPQGPYKSDHYRY